jgi:hypothetical protein
MHMGMALSFALKASSFLGMRRHQPSLPNKILPSPVLYLFLSLAWVTSESVWPACPGHTTDPLPWLPSLSLALCVPDFSFSFDEYFWGLTCAHTVCPFCAFHTPYSQHFSLKVGNNHTCALTRTQDIVVCHVALRTQCVCMQDRDKT